MGVSIDHIPNGSKTTDTQPPVEHGTQPPQREYGMQPPPFSDVELKRKVQSLASVYGTQPPDVSDARLKRDLRPL